MLFTALARRHVCGRSGRGQLDGMPLRDGGGTAFGRAGATSPAADAANVGLEQVGVRRVSVWRSRRGRGSTVSSSHSVQGRAPRKRNRNEKGRRSPLVSVMASSARPRRGPPRSASVASGDAVALEVVDEVVDNVSRRSARRWRSETRAPPRASSGGFASGVAAADHRDTRAGAELGLGRAGGVEDRQALVLREALDRRRRY